MDRKDEINEYLKKNHTGSEKAVFSEELERLFSMNGRTVRRLISSLRQDGHPICSSRKGYYYGGLQCQNRLAGCKAPGTCTDR